MSILGAMLGVPGRKATDISALTWAALLGESSSKAGVAVNIDTALRVSVVLACARVIAEGIAQMPLKLFQERADGGRDLAKKDPLYRLMWRRPNEWMTSFEFREALTLHAVLAGDGFAFINRVGAQVELLPIMPGMVTVRQSADYEITYQVRDAKGAEIGTFPRANMLHLRGPSWNSYKGLEIVMLAREAIGLALATEETHSRFFANGAQPGGILSFPNGLGPEQIDRIKKAFSAAQEGVANKFKTLVLDMGAKFEAMAFKGVDSQHLETRRFQIEEVCRALRVFPLMVMQSDKTATFASAEQFFLAHVIHTLGPWAERWEQVLDRDLIDEKRQPDLFFKHLMQGLMRGDNKSRAEYFKAALGAGGSPAWMRPNEVRALDDMNPDADGDYLPMPTKSTTGEKPEEDPPEPKPKEPDDA